ncbi:hypothetical protein [Syntrophomonas wolfei]|jgi:hypothetical protein|nr:hypothetical protein [Syntrophomonas wolfei]
MDYQYRSSLADFDFEVLNSEIEAYCEQSRRHLRGGQPVVYGSITG